MNLDDVYLHGICICDNNDFTDTFSTLEKILKSGSLLSLSLQDKYDHNKIGYMLAYKKLIFDYYPQFREGKFEGVIKSVNKQEKITKYELKLPTDTMFAKVHGDMMLHYSVYENQGIVFLETITPEDILAEGHQSELTTYKGVMVSKSHKDKDIFKINLLNMLDK